jgi:hypothetical protein
MADELGEGFRPDVCDQVCVTSSTAPFASKAVEWSQRFDEMQRAGFVMAGRRCNKRLAADAFEDFFLHLAGSQMTATSSKGRH